MITLRQGEEDTLIFMWLLYIPEEFYFDNKYLGRLSKILLSFFLTLSGRTNIFASNETLCFKKFPATKCIYIKLFITYWKCWEIKAITFHFSIQTIFRLQLPWNLQPAWPPKTHIHSRLQCKVYLAWLQDASFLVCHPCYAADGYGWCLFAIFMPNACLFEVHDGVFKLHFKMLCFLFSFHYISKRKGFIMGAPPIVDEYHRGGPGSTSIWGWKPSSASYISCLCAITVEACQDLLLQLLLQKNHTHTNQPL